MMRSLPRELSDALDRPDHLDLANWLYETVIGAVTHFEAWGFYLHNPSFEGEEELKNKLFVLWACGLMDTVEASNRFIPDAVRLAEQQGFTALVHNGNQLCKFGRLAADLLSRYTRVMQITMQDMRAQWVHGYYSARYRKTINVKTVVRGKVKVEHLSRQEHGKILEAFAAAPGAFEEKLTAVRLATFSVEHPYWTAIEFFRSNGEDIYRMLQAGEMFNINIPDHLPYSGE